MEKKDVRKNMVEMSDNIFYEEVKVVDKLKKVKDVFFGMNPRNKFWILEALLVAKRGELIICDNEVTKDDFILCCVDTSLLAVTGGTDKTLKEWEEKGIKARYAVGRTSESIKKLLTEVEDAFTDRESYRGAFPRNIFSIKQMEPLDLMEICHILLSLPTSWFEYEAASFTEEILSNIASFGGKQGGMFFQPTEVTRLMNGLLDIKGGSVYNPYGGLASYGTLLGDNVEYHAQEISQMYLVARLNLLLHGKDDSYCVQGDSVTEWLNRPFDYIIATPPFNAKIAADSNETMDADFFAKAYTMAKKKVAAIVSGKFCISTGGYSFAIRKNLVEKDLIESVIMLPENLLFGTNISSSIVIINKEKEHKGKIRFVNAISCYKKNRLRNILDVDTVLRLVQSDDKYHTALVDNSEIFANGCSLVPVRYIARMLPDAKEGEKYLPFADFLTPYARKRANQNEKSFSVVSFPDNAVQLSVNSSDFPKKEIPLGITPFDKVTDDCLVISAHGGLHSVFVRTNGIPFYAKRDYLVFTVDTSVVLPEYLVTQLQKAYVIRQFVVGQYVSAVKQEDLLTSLVLVPSLKEQQAIIDSYKDSQLQAMGIHMDELIEKKKTEYINEVRMRKHDLIPYTRELGSIQRRMQRIIESSTNLESLKSELSDKLRKHNSALQKLSRLLEELSREESFGKPEIFNLDEYFIRLMANNDYDPGDGIILGYEVDDNALKEYGLPGHDFDYSLGFGWNSTFEQITKEYKIVPLLTYIAPNDFERVVRNVLENAEKHGFDEEEMDWRFYHIDIRLTIDAEKGMFQIDFRNDGKPFPKGMDKVRYGILGEKAGENAGIGKGGHIVKQIVEHYGGDYDVFNDGDYPTVRIWLPIRNEEENE